MLILVNHTQMPLSAIILAVCWPVGLVLINEAVRCCMSISFLSGCCSPFLLRPFVYPAFIPAFISFW